MKNLQNMLSGKVSNDELNLLCPVCKDEYVHLSGSKVVKGNDNYEAWAGRGGAIFVSMWCESGHSWDVRFGFHKGETSMNIENVRNIDIEEFDSIEDLR